MFERNDNLKHSTPNSNRPQPLSRIREQNNREADFSIEIVALCFIKRIPLSSVFIRPFWSRCRHHLEFQLEPL